ncbi:MAG: FHA domain-containing protein [Prevotellaceae bacterium]|jgi:pSer/pThr/pTyr-binding forkhead associated (FHA) protein|nr:FHA domain-containing protein [Prevotellaceae bacterium]
MKVVTIGRSSANDVKINDPYVGQHHCQVIEDNGNFRLIDLNSKNGTYVNGIKIKGEVMLYSTDIIKIGNTVLPWKSYFYAQVRTPYIIKEGYTNDMDYTPAYEQPKSPPIIIHNEAPPSRVEHVNINKSGDGFGNKFAEGAGGCAGNVVGCFVGIVIVLVIIAILMSL